MKVQKTRDDKVIDSKIVGSSSSSNKPPVSGMPFIDSLVSQHKSKLTNSGSQVDQSGIVQRMVILSSRHSGMINSIDTDKLATAKFDIKYLIDSCMESNTNANFISSRDALEFIQQQLEGDNSKNALTLLEIVESGLQLIRDHQKALAAIAMFEMAQWKNLPEKERDRIHKQEHATPDKGDPRVAEEMRLARGGEVQPLFRAPAPPAPVTKQTIEEFQNSRANPITSSELSLKERQRALQVEMEKAKLSANKVLGTSNQSEKPK